MDISLESKKKTRRLKVTLSVLSILSFIFGLGWVITYNNYVNDANVQNYLNLQSQLSSARNTLTSLRNTISQDNQTINSQSSQINSLSSQINSLQTQITSLQTVVQQDNTKINALELQTVTIMGSARTNNPTLTYAKSITFQSGGEQYTTTVNGTSGFSINLPNNVVYTITITWGYFDRSLGLGGSSEANISPYTLASQTSTINAGSFVTK